MLSTPSQSNHTCWKTKRWCRDQGVAGVGWGNGSASSGSRWRSVEEGHRACVEVAARHARDKDHGQVRPRRPHRYLGMVRGLHRVGRADRVPPAGSGRYRDRAEKLPSEPVAPVIKGVSSKETRYWPDGGKFTPWTLTLRPSHRPHSTSSTVRAGVYPLAPASGTMTGRVEDGAGKDELAEALAYGPGQEVNSDVTRAPCLIVAPLQVSPTIWKSVAFEPGDRDRAERQAAPGPRCGVSR